MIYWLKTSVTWRVRAVRLTKKVTSKHIFTLSVGFCKGLENVIYTNSLTLATLNETVTYNSTWKRIFSILVARLSLSKQATVNKTSNFNLALLHPETLEGVRWAGHVSSVRLHDCSLGYKSIYSKQSRCIASVQGWADRITVSVKWGLSPDQSRGYGAGVKTMEYIIDGYLIWSFRVGGILNYPQC